MTQAIRSTRPGGFVGREIEPGRVFDLALPLDDVAEAYGARDERRAIKSRLRP
jgi:hypothetical protein